jgi:hypothetical protein
MKTVALAILFATAAMARTDFWAPVVPPRAHYAIDAKFIPDASRLEGTETIRFRNDTLRPIGRVALDWYGEILGVRANGASSSPSPGKQSGTLDDYEVGFHAPDGYAVGTSGRFDPGSGEYRAERVAEFGLFIGKGYESAEADAGDVHVRAVFTPAGRPCAELLLRTAIDVVGFYRERFGFYPQRSLTIVPGMDYPAGGVG